MQNEKVRIYHLAHELDMESKALLDLCRNHGMDVKNQLSTLSPEQRESIVALVRKGPPSAPPQVAVTPVLQSKNVPNLTSQRPPVISSRPAVKSVEAAVSPAAGVGGEHPVSVEAPEAPTPEALSTPAAASSSPPATAKPPEEPPRPPETPPTPPHQPTAKPPYIVKPPVLPHGGAHRPVRILGAGGSRGSDPGTRRPTDRDRSRIPGAGRPSGGASGYRVAPAPPPRPGKAPEKKEPPKPAGPVKLGEIPPELMKNREGLRTEDIIKAIAQQQQPPLKGGGTAPIDEIVDDEEGDRKKGASKRPGRVVGSDARHNQRNIRQAERKSKAENDLRGGRVGLLTEDEPRVRIKKQKKKVLGPTQPRKGKVPISFPISVRSLSEAIGKRSVDLLFKLNPPGAPAHMTINSTVDPETAESLALEAGCELEIKRAVNLEEDWIAEARKPDNPDDLRPRAPIVTIMGHVDHGKTSLLDKIRQSNVAATEAGGITQVIRAWRVEHGGRPITFLDTPGHEAFTKMRARGANVTDIAVIVVAADDGVMPQTEEAIAHAKAGGVSLVVSINKVDLPNANVNKTRQQLYGLDVLPDNMAGDTPFVETSAAIGKGIDELLESLSVVAELKELKANPNKPASGTCLEAKLIEEEGVFATLLVRDGTLHKGDVILVGAAYGRVRALYDDLGRPIEEAGPSVPVRITGLDEVPNADDSFLVVPDLSEAREIAERRKDRQQEAALAPPKTMRLEDLALAKVAELKVILKAEARGSIEAIRKELDKLQHEEVRVRILHAAIGGITESDVQLALTSPQDTLILGFNVVPDDRARAMAEERGIQIRQYNIIYNLTDDVKSALEGKLKPREEIIHLGRAVVRETFKISRVGTIDGCHVTQGVIERSAKVRLIRSGVVVYPPADRTAGLESLKRFKEDVKEVREGYDCGLKVAGYDDVKVDDVIEAYRVEQVQRTLS